MNAIDQKNISDRTRILSILAWLIGGWNVNKGITLGHLSDWDFHFGHDDEKLLRYLLEQYKNQVTSDLKQENITLKAKICDLQERIK